MILQFGAGSAVVGVIWAVTENSSTSTENEQSIDMLELAEGSGLINDHLVFLRVSRIELGEAGESACMAGLQIANKRIQNIQKQVTKLNKVK